MDLERFRGVVLFPFDGNNCHCILSCIRMMLFKRIFSFEKFEFNMLLSFRIAIHVGNTIYMDQGSTSNIVSDSINSIFHIGQKYAKPGNFYITDDAFKFVSDKLKDLFAPAGHFEGRDIMRMKVPV